jgi:ABC-type dipeptide/oligopeptide/nickel transport system ATPase subunit
LNYRELSSVRRKIQLIFQDSASALNSRMSVAELISEPLDIAAIGSRAERRRCVTECLEQVRLGPEHLTRSSLELSGGQRQRVAIARALTLAPKLLILDEAFSGLDLLVQEQILEVLRDLQRTQALTYLLITHDLGLASVFSERIAIMHQGRIVEQGKTSTILSHPKQSQTAALIAAVPKFTMRLAAEGGA